MKLFNVIDRRWCENKYGVVYCKSEKLISWAGVSVAIGGIVFMLMDFSINITFFVGATIALFGASIMNMVVIKAFQRRTLELMK